MNLLNTCSSLISIPANNLVFYSLRFVQVRHKLGDGRAERKLLTEFRSTYKSRRLAGQGDLVVNTRTLQEPGSRVMKNCPGILPVSSLESKEL